MQIFYGTPVFNTDSDTDIRDLVKFDSHNADVAQIKELLSENKLILISSLSFENSTIFFRKLVDHFGLADSYAVQMQFVVHMMEGRKPKDDVAVTVNERGPFQIIQPHSEGDSTSPLEFFGLYCKKNSNSGGENILSLINQSADHSKLTAKEKVIVGENLSDDDINRIRGHHLDAKEVISNCLSTDKILNAEKKGKLVVRKVPIKASRSVISKRDLYTYWDNVTVHDHAFHKHQYELLKKLNILNQSSENSDYKNYMHVEDDSDWAPADTQSGDISETAKLFDVHILHKMKAHDFLIFNNRAWTHSVNNWLPGEEREMFAMYA